jgi:hypothetical protein
MMAREETVMRQAELSVFAPADHERIVLIEGKCPSRLWARDDIQCYTHSY